MSEPRTWETAMRNNRIADVVMRLVSVRCACGFKDSVSLECWSSVPNCPQCGKELP